MVIFLKKKFSLFNILIYLNLYFNIILLFEFIILKINVYLFSIKVTII